MIVGTAGHIDHGKTTLVRALTGVDTDRLPEEKRRGISIELGFAYLDVPADGSGRPAARIGFVDVPGHERLVHTMLAGATGIHFALLLVAADDGVMPQTREHLAVLSLLGLSRGAVAITKADRVDTDRVAAVCADVAALLAGTPLQGAPVLPVSAQTGTGLAALRALLFEAAVAAAVGPRHDPAAAFRLAVDRAFTLDGVGTVATGTVHAGRVRIGDELALAPLADGLRVRVRSLHAQNRAVDEAEAGQRCAVGLAGVSKEQIGRGDWLVAPAVVLSTQRLDATLTLWHAETRPLRSGTPVHVHVGAASVLGTVAVLAPAAHEVAGAAWQDTPGDGDTALPDRRRIAARGGSLASAASVGPAPAANDTLAPGDRAHVQIVLREPIAAWHGDRIVLRDAAASRTVAGGVVLDPFAPARYRRTPQRLAELDAWSQPTSVARLASLVAAAPHGVPLGPWAVAEGLDTPAADIAGDRSTARPTSWPLPAGTLRANDAAHGDWALGATAQATVRDAALGALRSFHTAQPDGVGPSSGQLRRRAAPRLPEPLWRALLSAWQTAGELALRGAFVQLPEHAARLSATDARLAQKLAPLLAQAGDDGAWARDLARDVGEGEALVRVTLARLAQRGEVHQVVKDLFYPPPHVARLAALARQAAAAGGGGVTAAAFRDAAGLGRKRAIQLLEYFDRIGLLRRVGDVHRWRGDAGLVAETPAPGASLP